MVAARTWPPSFSHHVRPRKSSIAPTAVATAAPIRIPRTPRERSRKASDGMMIPKNIARPPRRGIGIWWRRRAAGGGDGDRGAAALVGEVARAEPAGHPGDRRCERDRDHQREQAAPDDLQ